LHLTRKVKLIIKWYKKTLTEYNCYSGFTGDTGSYSLSVFYIPWVSLWRSRITYTVIYWTRSQNDVFDQKYNAKSIQKLNYFTSLLTRCNHTLSPLKGDAIIRYLPWREMHSCVISLEGRCNHTLSPLKGDAIIRYLPWREMHSCVISLEGRCNHTLSPLKGDAIIRYLPWREMQSYVISLEGRCNHTYYH
jgi:hypothetical protein